MTIRGRENRKCVAWVFALFSIVAALALMGVRSSEVVALGTGLHVSEETSPRQNGEGKEGVVWPAGGRQFAISTKKPEREATPLRAITRSSDSATESILTLPANIFVAWDERVDEILGDSGSLDSIRNILVESSRLEESLRKGPMRQSQLARVRMKAIDALATVAGLEKYPMVLRTEAIATLKDLVSDRIPRERSSEFKKCLLGEKRDALSALVRAAPHQAAVVYAGLTPRQRSVLADGYIAAMVATGLTEKEASAQVHAADK